MTERSSKTALRSTRTSSMQPGGRTEGRPREVNQQRLHFLIIRLRSLEEEHFGCVPESEAQGGCAYRHSRVFAWPQVWGRGHNRSTGGILPGCMRGASDMCEYRWVARSRWVFRESCIESISALCQISWIALAYLPRFTISSSALAGDDQR